MLRDRIVYICMSYRFPETADFSFWKSPTSCRRLYRGYPLWFGWSKCKSGWVDGSVIDIETATWRLVRNECLLISWFSLNCFSPCYPRSWPTVGLNFDLPLQSNPRWFGWVTLYDAPVPWVVHTVFHAILIECDESMTGVPFHYYVLVQRPVINVQKNIPKSV